MPAIDCRRHGFLGLKCIKKHSAARLTQLTSNVPRCYWCVDATE